MKSTTIILNHISPGFFRIGNHYWVVWQFVSGDLSMFPGVIAASQDDGVISLNEPGTVVS